MNKEFNKLEGKYKNYKHYFTINTSYLVYYNDYEVVVYNKFIELIKTFKYVKMFVGKSPKNKMTEVRENYGKKYDGNSLLFQINKNGYIFIGEDFYTFKIFNDNIINFYSPIGSGDTSYPFITGEFNIYFMLDRKYVDRKFFNKDIDLDNETNLYDYYYNDKNIKKNAKKIKNIVNIF